MDGKAPLATGEDDDDEVPGRNLHLWSNWRILEGRITNLYTVGEPTSGERVLR